MNFNVVYDIGGIGIQPETGRISIFFRYMSREQVVKDSATIIGMSESEAQSYIQSKLELKIFELDVDQAKALCTNLKDSISELT